jgi:AcrR family transcriptional regulator
MARTRANRRGDAPTPEVSEADRIIDATLALIAQHGWRRLSLSAIAVECGLPILSLYRLFPSKQAILAGYYRRIDEAVLAEPPEPEAGERPRDRLFDLLMRRFDALRPQRGVIEVLRRELRGDPVAALCLGGNLLRSLRWTLEAAGIPVTGLRGAAAVKLTAAAYLSTSRVWLGDESPDLARTMAVLDARLRRIERWLVASGGGRVGEPEPSAA